VFLNKSQKILIEISLKLIASIEILVDTNIELYNFETLFNKLVTYMQNIM